MTESGSIPFREQFAWGRRVLWRGKLLILVIMAAFVIPAALYLQQAVPRFTASAQVLVLADESDNLLDRSASLRWRQPESLVQTEVAILKSRPLIQRLIHKLQLDQDPEFNFKLRKPDPFETLLAELNPMTWISRFLGGGNTDQAGVSEAARTALAETRIANAVSARFNVETQRRSQVIFLRFTSENREKAALIVNTLAELYVLERLEAGFDEARRVSAWLSERLEALRRDVVKAEQAVEEHRTLFGLTRRSDKQQTVTEQQLTELNSRLVMARADLAQKRARLGQIRSLTAGGEMAGATDVLQSSLIQRLREQEVTLQRELSEVSKTYGDRHPRLIGLRADIGEMRSKIAVEIERVAASVGNEMQVAQVGVDSIQKQLTELRRDQERAGEASIRLRELEREADAGRQLYEAFLARFKRSAEQEEIQRANARILSPAAIPTAPSFPRKRAVLLLALVGGLFCGIGLLFLLDRLDNLVRTADDAETAAGLPVLAVIPLVAAEDLRQGLPEEAVIRRPRSSLSDGLRSLRTAVELADGTEQEPAGGATAARIIMVTSSTPQEGKTFISVSLARLYARHEKRVLLIDCDVHRARAHAALGMANEGGLIQVATGAMSFDEAVQRDPLTLLDVLTAGVGVESAAEILTGAALPQMLERLSGRYERIIIDSPPVLAVSDTRALAPLAHQVIYLARWNKTPRDAVRNGVKILRDSGARLSGIVLSQVDTRRYDRYAYGDYGSYYGRYADYYGD